MNFYTLIIFIFIQIFSYQDSLGKELDNRNNKNERDATLDQDYPEDQSDVPITIYPNNNQLRRQLESKNNNSRSNENFRSEYWMTDLSENKNPSDSKNIRNCKIKDIIFAGTHDSGTKTVSNIISSDGRVPGIAKIAASKIAPWSKTQDLNVFEQLMIGVRFFDFRVSNEKDGLYLSHGLRGEKLSDVLTSMSKFAKIHPKELIMVKVKGFPDEKCKKVNINKLITKEFNSYLRPYLLSRKDLKQSLPLTPLKEIMATRCNIVVIFDTRVKGKQTNNLIKAELSENDWLFDGEEVLYSPWGNTFSVPKLYDYTIKTAKIVPTNKLYALHWTLTADAKYIMSHLGTGGIRSFTEKLNGGKYGDKYSLSSIISKIPRVNIVQHDFITEEKCRFLIKLNLQ